MKAAEHYITKLHNPSYNKFENQHNMHINILICNFVVVAINNYKMYAISGITVKYGHKMHLKLNDPTLGLTTCSEHIYRMYIYIETLCMVSPGMCKTKL